MPTDRANDLYDAFISYSHLDEPFASRLERALEKYRPPRELGRGNRHLSIFRDAQDLTGSEYYSSISEALDRSRKFIVICSPAARASAYVDDEVRRFIEKRGIRDVITVLLSGRPNNEVTAEDESSKAFPEALCRTGEMPLAVTFAGFNPRRRTLDTVRFADSWYALLANIFDTTRSQIEQRERVRRRRQVLQLGALAIVIIALLTAAMIYAFLQRNIAIAQRDAAEKAMRLANSRAAAATALQTLDSDPLSALSLAITAANAARTPEAEQAMRATLGRPWVRAILAHGVRVTSFSFNTSGTRAATGAENGDARIWDIEAGKEIAQLKGHKDIVRSIVFSPDDRWVLTGSNDGSARIWDATSGGELASLRNGNDGVDARWTPDGRRVVTVALRGPVTVWDIKTATVEKVFSLPAGFAYDLSSRGELAAADSDGNVRLLDLARGEVRLQWKAHEESVNHLAFNAAGDRIVTAAYGGAALWDSRSGALLQTFRRGHSSGRTDGVAFSPDGRRIVTTSVEDSTAVVWDVATGRPSLRLQGHRRPCLTAASFSPDGSMIVTAGGSEGDNTARVWDAATGREIAELRGYRHEVVDARFDPQGRRIMTKSLGIGMNTEGTLLGDIRIWDLEPLGDGAILRGTAKAKWAAFTPDGRSVAATFIDGTARIWDASTGRLLRVLSGHRGEITAVDLSPDGRFLLTGGLDGTARLWETATGRPLTVVTHRQPVRSVAIASDGMRIATASEDHTAIITDVDETAHKIVLSHTEGAYHVRFSPDGRYLLTADYDVAHLWDARSGQLLHDLRRRDKDPRGARDVDGEFGTGGKLLTRSSIDGTVRMWDIQTGREVRVLRGHEHEWLFHASFSPDGRTIVTAGEDRTARLWDAESGKMRAVLKGHDGAVVDAAFSPDGRLIATAAVDETVRIWRSSGQFVTRVNAGSRIWHVTFDLRGRRVAAACDDGTVRLYLVDYGDLLNMARARLPVFMTPDARNRQGTPISLSPSSPTPVKAPR
jgi:WD40 repeat protein